VSTQANDDRVTTRFDLVFQHLNAAENAEIREATTDVAEAVETHRLLSEAVEQVAVTPFVTYLST
jgi:hypothetical protein